MSPKMVPCCAHTLGHCFDLSLKSLAQKLTEKIFFLQNLCYVTCCDLNGHRRSKVMVQNKMLYMSSYL